MTTMTQTFHVDGMTCQNCVHHVTEALRTLPDVRAVDVDLSTGVATLQVGQLLDTAIVAAALDEAGYELAK